MEASRLYLSSTMFGAGDQTASRSALGLNGATRASMIAGRVIVLELLMRRLNVVTDLKWFCCTGAMQR
jgi:hypothetical protein